MSVLEKVSKYYKSFLQKLNQPTSSFSPLQNTLTNNLVITSGHFVLNPTGNGFYCFKDDENNQYYITNIKQYLPSLKERRRIHVILEVLQGVENIERWRKTAILHSIKSIR